MRGRDRVSWRGMSEVYGESLAAQNLTTRTKVALNAALKLSLES